MALKTLRVFHVYEVVETLDRVIEKLADIFYTNRYLFQNIKSWAVAGIKFWLFVHYYACGWVWIYTDKQREGLPTIEFSDDTQMAIYVNSFYLVTTTISTVGYGDFKGFVDDGGLWITEM